MAKYTRFDPRNKKDQRHKKHSLDRDLRLRRQEDRVEDKRSLLKNYESNGWGDEWDETVLD